MARHPATRARARFLPADGGCAERVVADYALLLSVRDRHRSAPSPKRRPQRACLGSQVFSEYDTALEAAQRHRPSPSGLGVAEARHARRYLGRGRANSRASSGRALGQDGRAQVMKARQSASSQDELRAVGQQPLRSLPTALDQELGQAFLMQVACSARTAPCLWRRSADGLGPSWSYPCGKCTHAWAARAGQRSAQKSNAPDRIRTCDLRFRRPTLYPTELRALGLRGWASGGAEAQDVGGF